jgi:uncharacterized protein YbjT (DUF2867 family)
MPFVVFGVSGNTGRVVAEALLAKKKSVRVVVRDAKKGEDWRARGAEVAVADTGDVAALTRALTGAEGAYLLVPPAVTAPDYAAHQAATVESFQRAIGDAGVPHVVLLSSIGAQHPSGTGPIAGLHHAEKSLSRLGATRFSFVRAAYFIENEGAGLAVLPHGIVPTFLPKDLAHEMVATRDIGELAATLLLEGTPATNQVVELSHAKRSASDVADALTAITGKPIAAAEQPLSEVVPTFAKFGLSANVAELYREMYEGIISGRVAFEGGHRREVGKTTVEDVLRSMLASAG